MKRHLQGTVNLPGSKSESNRALMIAAYGGFAPAIENLSEALDTVLMKALLERIKLSVPSEENVIDCEDAGTVVRFLMTNLVGKPGTWILTGTERLYQRPMAPLIEALRQLGADIIPMSNLDSLPLRIIGKPIEGGEIALDASQSSQFASSLLMAAPTWDEGLHLTLTGNKVSEPYIDMTLSMMEYFGIQCIRDGRVVTVPHQTYQQRRFSIEADWSSASYWYEMLALSDGGNLLLKGLKSDSLQGDAVLAEWFQPLGVATAFEEQGARLTKITPDPQKLVFDFTNHPDLFPAVYATCFALSKKAVFKGTDTLSHKESDRIKAMKTELERIGENVVLCAHNDHRIAMSLAALWPLFGTIAIDNPSVVGKSYPGFWKDLQGMV